jgi:hypothetical protein
MLVAACSHAVDKHFRHAMMVHLGAQFRRDGQPQLRDSSEAEHMPWVFEHAALSGMYCPVHCPVVCPCAAVPATVKGVHLLDFVIQ